MIGARSGVALRKRKDVEEWCAKESGGQLAWGKKEGIVEVAINVRVRCGKGKGATVVVAGKHQFPCEIMKKHQRQTRKRHQTNSDLANNT